jgi:type I restriction enzyme M protein
LVRKQVVAKTFVQSTIATLGNRLQELILPIPKDKRTRSQIEEEVKRALLERAKHRRRLFEFRGNDRFLDFQSSHGNLAE